MAASLKVIDGDQGKVMNNSDREKALEAALRANRPCLWQGLGDEAGQP